MANQPLISILTELRSLPGETEVVEFKEASNGFDFTKLGRYFSSLCNEANLKGKSEAWLIFGVENKLKNIVGSNYRINRPYLDSLKGEIAKKTTNRLTFIEVHELNLPEGRVVMFQIPAAPRGMPIAFEGHFYGRDGEEISPLNLDEIERIRNQQTRLDWSACICTEATIEDLDIKAIQKAKANFKLKNPRLARDIDRWDDSTFLAKCRMLVKGKPTRACILLLGKTESVSHISPAIAQISWVLYTKDHIEKDYAHFSPPYINTFDEVFQKIRNLKYRYLKDGTLFPDEVDQYDPQSIKEALSNCIAHMDYSVNGRITLAENEDGFLSFTNPGAFLPGTIENVIKSDDPPSYNRNALLAESMVSFNMIDSIGSGIKRMFRTQRERFFPMPDYVFENHKVRVTLIGKVLDIDYARVLVRNPRLTLNEIMLLDKVQKRKPLAEEELKSLREKKLIEGKKPNVIISARLAQTTGQKAEYTRKKGFGRQQYFDWILQALSDHGSLSRKDIEVLLIGRLSDLYDERQKTVKINNLISELRRKGHIKNIGSDSKPIWVLDNKRGSN